LRSTRRTRSDDLPLVPRSEMSDFQILDITPEDLPRICSFSHPRVSAEDWVNEWLDTRIAWVVARARRSSPAPRVQSFLVTHTGLTNRVDVSCSDDGIHLGSAQV
jgi:hypothetical protein